MSIFTEIENEQDLLYSELLGISNKIKDQILEKMDLETYQKKVKNEEYQKMQEIFTKDQ